MKKVILSFVGLILLGACKNKQTEPIQNNAIVTESTTQPEDEGEWLYLSEGEAARGWRAYNEKEGLPEGWVIENGIISSLGKGGDIGGDIVFGNDSFGEFELLLEWKIAKGGNSGIFYHVVEGEEYEAPYFTGPEYQIRDHDANNGDPLHILGADYGMYKPTYAEDVVDRSGQWNSSRIIFTNKKVTYYLNGQKTVEFVPWSSDWNHRKATGKWKDFPEYGEAKTGLIGLQDHGSEIYFRNIRIKKL
ncbi:DUF1080 domain-containing protein [Antarcticibacterium arcticum]|uniref:DUF1080 domain-containing protein n=1 Tax=Antarcticibacterium arcticum TaxID=2585771 RepID=A0A5B8YGE7_9FLAO|nr:DUF1080 domain-containing protein [Antarcticibacterium arcticum]QED37005.1 DUF1080 domain-containing protein [Antarcticibacterium arcticum]